MTDYLHRLPESARYPGDVEKGEILLVTDHTGRPARFGIVFEDEYLVVVRDLVRFPSGQSGSYVRIFEKSALDGPSGVVIVPMRDGRVLLRRVFRHATRAWELECPRGFREHGQTLDAAVIMEVDQELGLPMTRVTPLGSIAPNTGLFAGIAEAYCVELGPGVPHPRPEAQEAFGPIEEVTASELAGRIASGQIRDGFTLSALILAHARKLVRLAC
jgi:ADP-ribose pyrophosphatase